MLYDDSRRLDEGVDDGFRYTRPSQVRSNGRRKTVCEQWSCDDEEIHTRKLEQKSRHKSEGEDCLN